MQFNKQQTEILSLHHGIYCVSANPGSGKTATMVERVKTLVEIYGESEIDIMVISFTRAAVDSLKKKLSNLGLKNLHVHTFHSLSAKILTESGLNISKTIPLWKVENCFRKVNPKPDVESILSFIGFQKNHGRMYKDEFVPCDSEYSEEELRVFFKLYEEEKSNMGAYDFEDWLLLALKELTKNPQKYKFVIADETQDSNDLNVELLKAITDKNLMIVGDPKQSIYGFRGSNVKFFMNFDTIFDGAKVLTMDINYRSAKNIVDNANDFIRPYFRGYAHHKDSIANNQKDGVVKLVNSFNAAEESLKIADMIENQVKTGRKYGDIAILYRLNSNSEYIEGELKKRKIPYEISNDSSFFKRKEIHAILSYLKFIESIHDDGAFQDVFNLRNHPLKFMPASVLDDLRSHSGFSDKSMYESFIDFKFPKPWMSKSATDFYNSMTRLIMQKKKGFYSVETLIDNVVKTFGIEDYIKEKYPNKQEAEERIAAISVLKSFVKGNNLKSFLEFTSNDLVPKKKQDNAVQLLSVHRAKGLEWDITYLIGVKDGHFPHERNEISEETRLMYVGVTRAKEELYISEIGSDSRFVNEYFNKN